MFCTPGLVSGGTEGVGSSFHVLLSGLVLSGTEGVGSRFHVLLPGLTIGGTDSVGSRFLVLRAWTHFRLYRGRRAPFSCFALPNSFSAIPRAFDPVFMFCAPGLVFGGTVGIGSRFYVLRSPTHFRRFRGHRFPFSCFFVPVLIFGGTEGVGSNFHVLRSHTRFRWCAGRRLSFSCFALPNSFSAVPRASALVLKFCATGLIFGGSDGVGSRFHVLRPRTRFWRYRGCRVPFSCFALLDSFSAVPRSSVPVFMFCTPGLVFCGTEVFGSRFHVLRARTHFLRYRGRRVPFSYFSLPDSFFTVSRAPCPIFVFCAPALVVCGTEGVWSRFHVLRALTRFRQYRGCRVPFSCVECIGSGFMFCACSRFQRYQVRGVPFSCFSRSNSFSAVQRASGSVFMFCATGLVFSGIEEVGSSFMFCAPGLVFGGTEGVESRFHILRSRTRFLRYRGRHVPFSYFARLHSLSVVPRASGPVFMFCAP
jgi:hypothetical protein